MESASLPEDSFEGMDPAFPIHDPDGSADDDPLSTDELEQLYQQALRAVEVVDSFEEQLGFENEQDAEAPEAGEPAAAVPEAATAVAEVPAGGGVPVRQDVTARQILEAALFVGGTTLTVKKLTRLLGEEVSQEFIEGEIAKLNERYAGQQRPYEIRFGEGGYRLELKSEFERIRNRVFGLGPKEIKLSQDALEVLALVAYRQPVTKEQVEATGKKNAGGLLSQLLRRELVALERFGKTRKDVHYTTTPRFLQLFGLGDLHDLPQPDDLAFK